MYPLTEEQFKAEAEPILRQVFVNDDPFEFPFSPNIQGRRIIFPHQGKIERPLIEAIVNAASNLGDTGCYFTQLWPSPDRVNHCYISLSEFLDTYSAPPGSPKLISLQTNMEILSENVLYSAQGTWGVMLSHEYHGMLGGPPEFIEEIRRDIPDLDQQVYLFLNRFQSFKAAGMKLTLEWLPGLLTHVYGEEATEKMLKETGLP